VIAVGAIALAVLGAAQTGAGAEVLRDSGLAAQPERFSALAFAQPERLPTAISDGAEARIGFTVANREAGDRTYRWRLSTAAGTIDSGRLPVRKGETSVATAAGSVNCAGPKTRLVLRLERPHRELAVNARCKTAGGPDGR
jgi:hypothetical protein